MSESLTTNEEKKPSKPVVAGERGVQLQTMGEMYRFAQYALSSGMAPKSFGSPEAVMIAMQHGMEVGLSPMQAVYSIAVINGRPTIWGEACLALCNGRPDFVDCIETTEGAEEKLTAVCIVKRVKRADVVRRFSVADAKKAGLWGKSGPWSQYPARMLQMRARGFALRDAFPDALKGIGIREEVQDYHREERPVQRAKVIFPDEAEQGPEDVVPDGFQLEEGL